VSFGGAYIALGNPLSVEASRVHFNHPQVLRVIMYLVRLESRVQESYLLAVRELLRAGTGDRERIRR
jgi:hypothetical protein